MIAPCRGADAPSIYSSIAASGTATPTHTTDTRPARWFERCTWSQTRRADPIAPANGSTSAVIGVDDRSTFDVEDRSGRAGFGRVASLAQVIRSPASQRLGTIHEGRIDGRRDCALRHACLDPREPTPTAEARLAT